MFNFQIPISTILTVLVLSIFAFVFNFFPEEYRNIVGGIYISISLMCTLKFIASIRKGSVSIGKTTTAWLIDLSSGDNSEIRVYDKIKNPRIYKIITNLFLVTGLIFALMGILMILNIF